jgi:crotonobetainyl-CoA:carnitine CoA-transferase CaiB-like acyl-CoA transferase
MTGGALDGIRVLEITQVMAGAYCGMLLADLGADVIKVERPDIGDLTRWAGDGVDAFGALNRNKRGIAVDYRTAAGANVLRRLAADADVLVENHRPGTLAKHGLGADELRQLNPRLVYCSISGYGATGPRANQGGFDLMAQGMSGIMSITGPIGGDPCKAGVPIADLNAATFATVGILAALVRRSVTGIGQTVSTSLLESSVAYLVWEALLYFQKGELAEPGGSAHRLSAPYEAFATADGWITIAAPTTADFTALCHALGRADLVDDERFRSPRRRLANRAELAELITEITRTKSSADWNEKLAAAGVPSGPVHRIDQVFDDPQVIAAQMVEGDGADRRIGHPIKLSDTPMNVHRPSPALGADTKAVLLEAGFSDADIDAMLDSGAVAQAGSTTASEVP